MKSIARILILLALSALFSTSKKDKVAVNLKFEWFANGKSFHYDYYTAAGVQKDYIFIGVADDMLLPTVTDPANISQLSLDNVYGHYEVRIDGLYAKGRTDHLFRKFFYRYI
ncbi:MAG: hypothetical protein M3N14_06785 [Bacteroidota bacterium]|nr:hypothetical protein [Bacteroidota bacterium]